MTSTSTSVILVKRPQGNPNPTDFALSESMTAPLADGQFAVAVRWLAMDPMLRIFIDERPLGGTVPPLPIGSTIPGAALGEVIESRNPAFAPGSIVEGRLGWTDRAVSDGKGVRIVDPALVPEHAALGPLGLSGFTAYVGVTLAEPLEGRTILVSGAAGGVGSVLGPLAKARGARVIGIASGADKVRFLTEQAGYDAVIDRSAGDLPAQLAATVPDGVNVYVDNVGGPMFADVINVMARGGQVLICGLMAQYGAWEGGAGPDRLPGVLTRIMGRGLTIRPFSNTAYDHLRPAFREEVGAMLGDGRLPYPHCIRRGLAAAPDAFAALFTDSVIGKSLVEVA